MTCGCDRVGKDFAVHFFQDRTNVVVVVVVVAVAVVAVVLSILFDRMQETAGALIFEKQVRIHKISRSPACLCPPRQKHYQWTDGPTDGPTDRRTDGPTEWLIESRARD